MPPQRVWFLGLLVWKRAWILEVTAWGLKTGLENDTFWSEIGSGFGEPGGTTQPRIPRSTPTPGAIIPTCVKCHASHFQVAPAEPLFQSEAKWEAIHVFFYSNANKTHFHQKGFAFTFVLKVRVLEVGNSQNHQEWNSWRPHLSLESERNFRRPVYISSIQRLIISKLHSRLFQLLKSFLLALLLKYIFFTEIF